MPEERTIEDLVILAAKRLSNIRFFEKRAEEAEKKAFDWSAKAAEESSFAGSENAQFWACIDAIKNWGE